MRKVMRRRALSVLAAGSIAALLLSGCAGSSNDAGEGGDDARIRVARSFAPTAGLSPYSDDATTLSKFGSAETLVQLSDDLEAEPLPATDFEQVTTSPGRSRSARESPSTTAPRWMPPR